MARFRLSARAERDLEEIAAYTLRKWSVEQCGRYLDAIEDACQALADSPTLGRDCDRVRPGLRRFEQGRHVVFYRRQRYGVRIVRILHERMLPEGHDFDDE